MRTFASVAAVSTLVLALAQGTLAGPHGAPLRRHAGVHIEGIASNSTHTIAKRYDNSRFTWFTPGLGACGGTNGDNDYIVALNAPQFAGGAHCFETVTISFQGKTAKAQIVDECMECPFGALDFSPGLYAHFSDNKGTIYGSWEFGDNAQPEPKPEPKPTSTEKPQPPPTPTPTPTPTPSPSPSPSPKPKTKSSSTSSSVQSSSSSVASSTTAASSTTSSSSASAAPTPTPTDVISQANVALLQMMGIVVAGEQAE